MNREPVSPGCPGFEQLKSFVDREAAPAERADVERHLAGCPACREEVRIMERIGEEVRDLGGLEAPPAGLRARVLERIDPPRKAWALPALRFGWMEAGLATAVVALVAAILFPVLMPAREAARRERPRDRVALSPPAAESFAKGSPGGAAAGSAPGAPAMELQGAPAASSYSGPGVTPEDIDRYVRGREGEVTKRRVVQTADLTLRLKTTLEEAEKQVTTRISEAGGYVENSTLSSREDEERVATLTVRVPVESFERTVEWLSGLGEVTAKNVRGEDVTGTWIDQRAEVRELRDEEARLLRRFNAATSAVERDQARWELIQLRTRVRASEERLAAPAKMADLATLRVSLVQPRRVSGAGLMGDVGDTFVSAMGALVVAARVPLFILVWVLVFTPLWLPAVLVYRWISRARQAEKLF